MLSDIIIIIIIIHEFHRDASLETKLQGRYMMTDQRPCMQFIGFNQKVITKLCTYSRRA